MRDTVLRPLLLALMACIATVAWTVEASAQAKETIAFEVRLPANAVLEFSGKKMPETGEVRSFTTPPMGLGKGFNYIDLTNARNSN